MGGNHMVFMTLTANQLPIMEDEKNNTKPYGGDQVNFTAT